MEIEKKTKQQLEQELLALKGELSVANAILESKNQFLRTLAGMLDLDEEVTSRLFINKFMLKIQMLKDYQTKTMGQVEVANHLMARENAKLWHLIRGIAKDPTLDSPDHMAIDYSKNQLKTSPFVN